MATLRVHPQGEYDLGTMEDADGKTFCLIELPDNRTGDKAELVFNLPSFVAFADWVRMAADELVAEEAAKRRLP